MIRFPALSCQNDPLQRDKLTRCCLLEDVVYHATGGAGRDALAAVVGVQSIAQVGISAGYPKHHATVINCPYRTVRGRRVFCNELPRVFRLKRPRHTGQPFGHRPLRQTRDRHIDVPLDQRPKDEPIAV